MLVLHLEGGYVVSVGQHVMWKSGIYQGMKVIHHQKTSLIRVGHAMLGVASHYVEQDSVGELSNTTHLVKAQEH
jgi:hypothetical protein